MIVNPMPEYNSNRIERLQDNLTLQQGLYILLLYLAKELLTLFINVLQSFIMCYDLEI
jgi:hypothetical protein